MIKGGQTWIDLCEKVISKQVFESMAYGLQLG